MRPVFIPWQPTFESSVGQSTLIHEIAPKVVTLRKEDTFRTRVTPYGVNPPDQHHKTMFHEIKMIPFLSTCGREIRDLVANPPAKRQVRKKDFLSGAFEIFLDVVERTWIPERFHIVLHSGGYDSRLISYAIKELFVKNGRDWLGELVFLEVQGEDEHSWAALKAEGWDRVRFITYQEGWGRYCDFGNAWRLQNCGMFTKPFNHFYEPIAWLQSIGRAPAAGGKLQTWTGYLANDIAHALINGRDPQWVLQTLHHHPYFFTPAKGECVSPYLSLDLIRFLWTHGQGQEESQVQSYRRHILEWRSPRVAAVPNPQRGTLPTTLPLRLFNQIREEFRSSWYGQNVVVDAEQPTTVEFKTWWGHWALASFCEELRRRKHKIRLPR